MAVYLLYITALLLLLPLTTSSDTDMTFTVLVVGATGATGKHVVLQLLQKKQNVKAIVRSKEKLINSIDDISADGKSSRDLNIVSRLDTTEASLLDLSQNELDKIVQGCDAVVSCLGHNMSMKGLFMPPRKLVTEVVKRLTKAIENTNKDSSNPTKFILMGSDGVANPLGGDDTRSFGERTVLTMLRYGLPPHNDNEKAAAYISNLDSPVIEWVVVRPTDLINGEATKYETFIRPQKSLFGSAKDGIATRANVALFMVDLIMSSDEDKLWQTWKGKMPVLHDNMGGDVVCT